MTKEEASMARTCYVPGTVPAGLAAHQIAGNSTVQFVDDTIMSSACAWLVSSPLASLTRSFF